MRTEFQGRTYQTRSWTYELGSLWAFRLMKLAGAAAIAGAGKEGSDAESLAKLLEQLDEKTFIEFRSICVQHTDLIGLDDETGAETVQPLAGTAATELRGKPLHVAMIMRLHVESEFKPFFEGLAEILR